MRKAFFSFVTISLVALVLFVGAAYLLSFKDFRDTAQYDLEIRRVAERMKDANDAFNRTLIDALVDAGYKSYDCSLYPASPPALSAPAFCDDFKALFNAYSDNIHTYFSDEIYVNITNRTVACVDLAAIVGTQFFNGSGNYLNISISKNVGVNVSLEIRSQNVVWSEPIGMNVTIDLSNTTILGALSPGQPNAYYGIRIRGAGTNRTLGSYIAIVPC
ncbi:MAG: hypothetical protein V1835_02095 [Candidatus Micrarchaeota archaeon]